MLHDKWQGKMGKYICSGRMNTEPLRKYNFVRKKIRLSEFLSVTETDIYVNKKEIRKTQIFFTPEMILYYDLLFSKLMILN